MEEGHSQVEASKIFRVSKRAIFLWIQKKKEQGELKLKLHDRKPYKIDESALIQYVQKNPDHYLREIAASFNVSVSAIFYARRRLKITYKKKHFSTSSGGKKNGKNSLDLSKE